MNDIKEKVAKIFYDVMPYIDEDGSQLYGGKPEWSEDGNSLKQGEARDYAQTAIDTLKANGYVNIDDLIEKAEGEVKSKLSNDMLPDVATPSIAAEWLKQIKKK